MYKENQYRVLVYPNITHQKDLRQDSWVYVMKNVLEEINKLRSDLFFTILTTEFLEDLDHDNTEQLLIDLPSYPNSMRTHFNFDQISEALDLKHNDYDIACIVPGLTINIIIICIYAYLGRLASRKKKGNQKYILQRLPFPAYVH